MVKSEYFYTRFEEGNGNPLQYSCQENLMDRGVWWATVHGVTKSWTLMHAHTHTHTTYTINTCYIQFSSVQLLSHVQLFVTP